MEWAPDVASQAIAAYYQIGALGKRSQVDGRRTSAGPLLPTCFPYRRRHLPLPSYRLVMRRSATAKDTVGGERSSGNSLEKRKEKDIFIYTTVYIV